MRLTVTFPFIRQVSSKATLPAVCWPVSGSESEHSVLRGAGPTGQKCCDGSEKATSQNEVLRLDYAKMCAVTQRSQLIPSPRSSLQWGGVARAHREKMAQQRDVPVDPGSASSRAKPLATGLDGGNRASSSYRWTTRGTAACSKCKILNVPAPRLFFLFRTCDCEIMPFGCIPAATWITRADLSLWGSEHWVRLLLHLGLFPASVEKATLSYLWEYLDSSENLLSAQRWRKSKQGGRGRGQQNPLAVPRLARVPWADADTRWRHRPHFPQQLGQRRCGRAGAFCRG